MKKIEVTYDVAVWVDGHWENGEAAAVLDLIPESVVTDLQAKLSNPKYRPTAWRALVKTITGLEEMRGRVFDKKSIKTIKIIG